MTRTGYSYCEQHRRSHQLRPWREIMKNTKLGRRNAGRLTAAAVALAAAFILAVMPAAAATINATDVTIRNTAEDKSDYSNAIGVLNEGDQVTVLSRTTDASGIEWLTCMNFISMQPSLIVLPAFTTFSFVLFTRLCSRSLFSTSPSVKGVP